MDYATQLRAELEGHLTSLKIREEMALQEIQEVRSAMKKTNRVIRELDKDPGRKTARRRSAKALAKK